MKSIILFIIFFLSIITIGIITNKNEVVEAAGITTYTTTAVTANQFSYYENQDSWHNATQLSGDIIGYFTDRTKVGWAQENNTPQWKVYATLLKFKIPDLPNKTFTSGRIILPITHALNAFNNTSQMYFTWYKVTHDDSAPINADFLNAKNYSTPYTLLTGVKSLTDLTGFDFTNRSSTQNFSNVPITFNIDSQWLQTLKDGNNNLWCELLSTNQALDIAPTTDVVAGERIIEIDNITGNKPYLELDYIDDANLRPKPGGPTPPPILINTPPTTENTNGVVTTIAWVTPRAAYADEYLIYDIQGTPGTPITLQLRDDRDVIISSVTDHIRTNGEFYWQITLADTSIDKFVRVIETSKNVVSQWGHISSKPSTNQVNLDISTNSTESALNQYPNQFKTYFTTTGDKFYTHWKTNLLTSDYNSTYFELNYLGNQNAIYRASMNWIASSYYLDSNLDHTTIGWLYQDVSNWRYIITTFDGSKTGYNHYDNMVIDLAQPISPSTTGFYKESIKNQSDASEITTTIPKGIWYGNTISDGITPTLNDSKYPNNASPIFGLQVSNLSGVLTYLNKLTYQIVDSSQNIYYQGVDTISKNTNYYYINNLNLKTGSYVLRFFLQSNITGNTFEYIQDIPFSVTPNAQVTPTPSATNNPNIPDIIGIMDSWSTGVKWLVMIISAIILGLIFRFAIGIKNSAVLTIIVLSPFGYGLTRGWVDTWVIIVLAGLGAIVVYMMIAKMGDKGGNEG